LKTHQNPATHRNRPFLMSSQTDAPSAARGPAFFSSIEGSGAFATPASSGGDGVCASSPCSDLLDPAASELTVAQLPDAFESLLQHHNLNVRA
jgi:hypothetical protein